MPCPATFEDDTDTTTTTRNHNVAMWKGFFSSAGFLYSIIIVLWLWVFVSWSGRIGEGGREGDKVGVLRILSDLI